MIKGLLSVLFCFFVSSLYSQGTLDEDSIVKGNLYDVIVRAFEQNKRLKDVPAAINYIGAAQLARFSNTSILPAINATPGVRMEERSPGSYRLNIRGSSLRSPFGVRNVKIYYNNIPLTDPGGNTFLNQLGFYNVKSLEIIKGPGSSLYGAGTGGVMLIESPAAKNELQVNYSTGSFNMQNIHAAVSLGKDDFSNTISYQHQTSDGYRQHTNMRRDMFSWNSTIKTNETNQITTNFLYGDLYYQIPGPLTLSEYDQNPASARPRVGFVPGSVETGAAIYQKTFLAGATYKQEFSSTILNTTSLYGAFTQLRNPTTRNYGRSSEPHFGGRTVFQFTKQQKESKFILHAGAEVQQGFTTLRIYSNKGGNPDTLQTDDELFNRQSFIFSQLSWQQKNWIVTAGASLNRLNVQFTRLSNTPFSLQKRTYNNEIAPRLAVLRKLSESLNIYGSIGKGFSPPTSAELLPSGGIINTGLNAEKGINYEVGAKGTLLSNHLSYDINAFYFKLKNTIVQRRDATGGDFFINGGETDQKGLESLINYRFKTPDNRFSNFSKLWLSHTYNRFKYRNFKQLNNDFSGKQLPSTAPHTFSSGLDLFSKTGLYINVTYLYSDPIYLNDANTVKASAYNLVGSRAGYQTIVSKKYFMDVFAGVDNLFDINYSLGNDINGFGDRYYNAAPRRNYFIGVSLKCFKPSNALQ